MNRHYRGAVIGSNTVTLKESTRINTYDRITQHAGA